MNPDNPFDESSGDNPGETTEQKAMSDTLKEMAKNFDTPKGNADIEEPQKNQMESEEIKTAWEKVLSKFPNQLQEEFRLERPNPTQEDVKAYESLQLLNPEPQHVPIDELLKNNGDIILRCTPDVIEEINKKWGTNFDVKLSKVYDQNPDRVRKYSQMPAETAEPSVSVNGEIMFGVGRFVAALLRKDNDLKVWQLNRKQ
jgi:hypothetical protein